MSAIQIHGSVEDVTYQVNPNDDDNTMSFVVVFRHILGPLPLHTCPADLETVVLIKVMAKF